MVLWVNGKKLMQLLLCIVVAPSFQTRMSAKRGNTTVRKSKWNARTSLACTCASVGPGISGDLTERAALVRESLQEALRESEVTKEKGTWD